MPEQLEVVEHPCLYEPNMKPIVEETNEKLWGAKSEGAPTVVGRGGAVVVVVAGVVVVVLLVVKVVDELVPAGLLVVDVEAALPEPQEATNNARVTPKIDVDIGFLKRQISSYL
jgi:hypothetical protein